MERASDRYGVVTRTLDLCTVTEGSCSNLDEQTEAQPI